MVRAGLGEGGGASSGQVSTCTSDGQVDSVGGEIQCWVVFTSCR